MTNNAAFYQLIAMLAQLLANKVSLAQAVTILAEQNNPLASRILSQMKKGSAFSDALALSYITADTSTLYIPIIKASEQTGTILSAVTEIEQRLTAIRDHRSKLISILCYPAAVILIACVGTLLLLFKGIPLFKSYGIIDASLISSITMHIVFSFALLLVLGTLVLFLFFYLAGKESVFYRLFYSLYILTVSGIPLDKALTSTLSLMNNQKAKKAVLSVKDSIANGHTVSASFKIAAYFPQTIITWLTVADCQGSAHEIFNNIALYYRQQDTQFRDRIQRLCEPAVILITGVYLAVLLQGTIVPLLTNFGGL